MEVTHAVSEGTLLGGRVIYRQTAQGYRTGIEPVLLAASVPARPGERVLEAGTGAGAGLLALCARVENIGGTGLERDPILVAIAAENLAANQVAQVRVLCASVEGWRADGAYDHVFANPPWHGASSTPSPDAARRGAKVAADGLLEGWIERLAPALRHRGTLSLIVPAGRFAGACRMLVTAGCPEIALLPLWPRQGVPAKLVILQAVKGGKGASRVLQGLVLHGEGGRYTPAAEAVLRDGAALEV